MKSAGEIEAQAGEAVNKFLQKTVGRGASTVTATSSTAPVENPASSAVTR